MKYSIYDMKTGLFTGVIIFAGDHLLDQNVPEGCSVLLGVYDHRSERVQVSDSTVVPLDQSTPIRQSNPVWPTQNSG